MSCTTPISWLALERHALGELTDAEKERIESHLAECDACASMRKSIAAKDDRPLRPLKRKRKNVVWLARPQVVALVAGLAVAAVLVFLIGRSPKNPDREILDPRSDRVKGSSEVGFTLVREDEAVLPEAGGPGPYPYRDGERFKALVTCPPGLRGAFDLVVYEPNAPPSFPLPLPSTTTDLACGNSVPLAGAFKLTGHEPMTVCLVWQDAPIDRGALERSSVTTLQHAQCKLLVPASD